MSPKEITMTKLVIVQPDDWHIHLRQGNFLAKTVADASRQFRRVLVMPNLTPPICTTEQAAAYKYAILATLKNTTDFLPIMTLYLTQTTLPEAIEEASGSGIVAACKLYPAGSTTHSELGVQDCEKLHPVFEKMQELDLPLCIHGEVVSPEVDIYDREARFIDTTLKKLTTDFPQLRIILEHVTTQEAIAFVMASSDKVAATITAHHLLLNRNDLLVGGIKPHYYCLPIVKRAEHQEALIKAATSGSKKFFIGSDSAPHAIDKKETACGCAGIYTAHAAIELYAEAFEQANALDKLEGFCSFNGPDFYKLPRNSNFITLLKEPWQVPRYYHYGDTKLIPFRADSLIQWKLVNSSHD